MDYSQTGRNDYPAMRTLILMLCFFYVARAMAQPAAASATVIQPPTADVSNGPVHARFYLPDAKNGYYRGSRFDWSGVMPVLEYRGHTYCGQWFDTYAPTIHDAIMGPVESFAPLGYETARPGGSFVAIGIGMLTKPDDQPYSPFRYYAIADGGAWVIKRQKAGITFEQTVKDSLYPYIYDKTVTLTKTGFRISHTLHNTGRRAIETTVYDHNLFVLDSQRIGPGFCLKFPWRITGRTEARNIGTIADIGDSAISFIKNPEGKEQVYAVLEGYGAYDIKEHNKTCGVHITCDRPLSRMVFWGSARTATPEPYIQVDVPPGKTFGWTIDYVFYIPTTP